jgi:hypothetical protein
VRTPILTTSSETCANAAGADKIAAAKAASLDSVLAEITDVLPLWSGALGVLFGRELKPPAFAFAINPQSVS